MNRPEFQRLLQEDAPDPAHCLPENFSREVLSRGRLFRRLVRRHWRWLGVASIVSLLVAIALGLSLVPSDSSRPALLLFQVRSDAAPFSME